MKPTIKKAVFPVAGLGTRFLPATKASPKEMLPVVDKPLIQYAVEEAWAAGITEMVFVTGRSKRSIEDHFDKAYELESELERRNKTDMLNYVRSLMPAGMKCIYIRQPEALGLGHAVLCAQSAVGNEPLDAPSTLAVVGRYVLTPRIFHHLAHIGKGAGGEIQLTDGIASLMQEEQVLAYRYSGKRSDCGSKIGYLEATLALARKHPEVGPQFEQLLKTALA